MTRQLNQRKATQMMRNSALPAAAFLLGAAASMQSRAQAPSIVQVPFVATVAGTPSIASGPACTTINSIGDGCPPTQAVMTPYGTTVDNFGNIYIADYGNLAIRVVYQGGSALAAAIIAANPTVVGLVPQPGYIYSLAGTSGLTKNPAAGSHCNGSTGPTAINSLGDGCPGTQSYVKSRGVTVDASGNVFFTNVGTDQSVRVLYVGGVAAATLITATDSAALSPQPGYIYSIAASTATAPMTLVAFSSVRDVAVDTNENVYVTDNTLHEVFETNGITGVTTVVAGTGTGGYNGDNITATTARIDAPDAVFLDANNNLYFSEAGGTISSVTYLGRLRVVYAKGAIPGLTGLTAGNIYTVAGGGTSTASGTLATQVNLVTSGIGGIDAAGNLYFTDNQRRVWEENASTGIAVILTGSAWNPHPAANAVCANTGTAGPTMTDAIDDGCPGPEVNILNPISHISFDRFGSFYVADQGADVIRRFNYGTQIPGSSVGNSVTQPIAFVVVTTSTINTETFTLQGAATAEFIDGGGNTCALKTSLAAGAVCVFNVKFAPLAAGSRLAAVTFASTTATLASSYLSGLGQAPTLSVDPGTQTLVGSGLIPSGTGTDLLGNIYISDSKSNQVFRSAAGATPLVVVTGLASPAQIAIDGKGTVFVADTANNRVASTPASGGSATLFAGGFSAPVGLAIDGYGDLYVADTGNNRIVEVQSGGGQIVLPITGLNSPSGLAVDTSGDLFIADTGNSRVVEFSPAGGQSIVNIGGNGTVTPVGVGVDPAGNLYIADAAGMQIIVSGQAGTFTNSLDTGLTSLSGLAVDSSGDVYAADAKTAGVVFINRAKGSVHFPATNLTQYSTSTILLDNIGNVTLTASGTQLTTATGNTAEFSIVPSNASNACGVGGSVAAGTNCQLTATFTPVNTVTYTETATFSDNATNVGEVSVVLTGTGVQLISTSTSLTITAPTGPPVYGQSITIAAGVTPASGSGTPSGTVTFRVDGQAQAPVGISGASITVTLPVGAHVITAVYSGDSVYATSMSSLNVSVSKATPTITFNVSQGATGLTFTASLGAATSTPTGTVAFASGATPINTATLVQGIAAYTSATLIYTSYTFTATYSGDSNYNSVSATSTNAGSFLASQTNSTITIPQGGVGTDTITLISQFGYSGTLGFSCSNLPANTVCAFSPASVTLAAGGNNTSGLQLITNVQPTVSAALERDGKTSSRTLLALLMPVGLLVLLRCNKLSRLRIQRLLLLCIVLVGLSSFSGLVGCGASQNNSAETPVGTYSVRVTVTGSSGTYVLTYTFVVLPGSTAARPT